MTGTVRAVDTKARTLDVITGVGHAVRLVRMRVAPACKIEVAGAAAPLGSVKPGHVVRIEYLAAPAGPKTPSGVEAQAIATLPVDGMGGTR